MPIVFSAVACDRNIVADFASCDGNFTEIADQVLSKLPPCNNKMTYSHGIYLLHYIAKDDYLYFCITDKLCQRSRTFLFLNEIQRRFMVSKQTKDFTTILAAEMYRYSEDYSTIEIRKGELDEINSIGVGCSESILGEKILYINNPDIISYSTISNVSATPGIISVLVESSISEGMSAVTPTIDKVSVVEPILDRILVKTLEQTSVKTLTPERTSVKSAIPERTLVKFATTERTLVKSATPERTSAVNPTADGASIKDLTPEKTPIDTSTPQRRSDNSITENPAMETLIPESTSLKNLASEKISLENTTQELKLIKELTGGTVMSPAFNNVTAITSASGRISVLSGDSLISQRVPDVTTNTETISSESLDEDRTSALSPRLYIVIIGMIILVISMLVYAFGPISCVIVTGVGIYSMFKYYMDSKDKSE